MTNDVFPETVPSLDSYLNRVLRTVAAYFTLFHIAHFTNCSLSLFLSPLFLVYSDLGAHIDGFIAVAAHTIVVDAAAGQKISGRQADVILAAYWAAQAALRLLKSGSSVSLVPSYPTPPPPAAGNGLSVALNYLAQHSSTPAEINCGNFVN